ncbi:MAG: hypothetical protein IPK25_19810 [Saprospiraceae bacterium]|nr:hypothetical protein [Saprospiraceae bacterium]
MHPNKNLTWEMMLNVPFWKMKIEQKVIIYQAKQDSIETTDEEVETQLDFRFDAVLRQMNGDESFLRTIMVPQFQK